jgi:hypothetical protein
MTKISREDKVAAELENVELLNKISEIPLCAKQTTYLSSVVYTILTANHKSKSLLSQLRLLDTFLQPNTL